MQGRLEIAVLGAGPLGTLVASQLVKGGAEVTLVKRRVATQKEHVQLVPELGGQPWSVELLCAESLPADVDLVVLAVRAEQLNGELLATLRSSHARSIVAFSPLLGSTLARWRADLPSLCVALPVLAAEFVTSTERRLHYWQMPSTLVERRTASSDLRDFVRTLRRGGAWVSWRDDVEARTLANTVALFPVHVAVFRKPSLRAWRDDISLRRELAEAVKRARRLSKVLGPLEPAMVLLVWWLSSANRISVLVRALNCFAPKVSAFVERHFGAKLGRQHAVLASEVAVLARRHGVPNPLCDEWMNGLPEVGSP